MKSLIKTYPVISFVILTFLYSWILWTLMILSAKGLLPFKFPTNFLGSFGPAFGALAVTGITRGRSGIKEIFTSLTSWRVPAWTYAFAIFFIILVYIISGVVSYIIDPGVIEFMKLPGLTELLLYFIVIAVIGGPLGEELGWRGFLQPALMERFNPAVSAMIIAGIWLVWHIPLFWLEGAAQEGGSILYFALSVFAMSFLFTFLYINTRGSLLIAMLFHTMINYVSAFIIPSLLPATETDKVFGHSSTLILLFSAALILIIFSGKFLTGKNQNQAEPDINQINKLPVA